MLAGFAHDCRIRERPRADHQLLQTNHILQGRDIDLRIDCWETGERFTPCSECMEFDVIQFDLNARTKIMPMPTRETGVLTLLRPCNSR